MTFTVIVIAPTDTSPKHDESVCTATAIVNPEVNVITVSPTINPTSYRSAFIQMIMQCHKVLYGTDNGEHEQYRDIDQSGQETARS